MDAPTQIRNNGVSWLRPWSSSLDSKLKRVARLRKLHDQERKTSQMQRLTIIPTNSAYDESYTVSWSADVFVCKPAHVANQNQRPNREVTFQTRTYWLFYCGQGSRYIDKACFLNIWWHNMALLGSWTIRLLHIVPFLNVMLCTNHMHPNTYLDNSNYLISIVSKDAITHI